MSGFANLRSGLATAGASLCFLASAAAAQECDIRAMTTSGVDKTDLAQSNFICMSSKMNAALSRIESLEADLKAFRGIQGMVVAFDRSEEEGSCPKGWRKFVAATGRFIVGAGVSQDKALTHHAALKNDPNSAIGGGEKIVLREDNLPQHDHLLAANNAAAQFLAEQQRTANPSLRGEDGAFGGRALVTGGPTVLTVRQNDRTAAPIGSMPPFVALYYCMKE